MKIAFLGIKGLPSKGGAERVVESVVSRLAPKGFNCTIYCSSRYTPREYRLSGVNLVRVPVLRGKHAAPTSLFFFSAIHALFSGYDLIHIHNVEACYTLPILKLRYKVISTSHGVAYKVAKWGNLAKRVIRLCDYLFISFSDVLTCVSKPLCDEYAQTYNNGVACVPNGIENDMSVDHTGAGRVLKEYGVESDYILFAAGRLDRIKGCHHLIEAFSRLQPHPKLVILGDSETDVIYSTELKQQAGTDIHFIPFLSDKAVVFGLLKRARLFVFPSELEAMSMALLEAASLGVPVLCSDIAANVAVLPHHAVYFRCADVHDLQKKLQWALDHPQEMMELATRAQQWVNLNFSWDVIVDRYIALYRKILSNGDGDIPQSHDKHLHNSPQKRFVSFGG